MWVTLDSVTTETQLPAMEKLVHARAMCTRPFLLLNSKEKGLGTRLDIQFLIITLLYGNGHGFQLNTHA